MKLSNKVIKTLIQQLTERARGTQVPYLSIGEGAAIYLRIDKIFLHDFDVLKNNSRERHI